jgi:translation initiation factor 1A
LQGDIILVGLREFGDDKGDVLMKYYDEEAKELKELGEIPEHIKINEGDFGFEEDGFQLDEEEKEEDDLDIDNVRIYLKT